MNQKNKLIVVFSITVLVYIFVLYYFLSLNFIGHCAVSFPGNIPCIEPVPDCILDRYSIKEIRDFYESNKYTIPIVWTILCGSISFIIINKYKKIRD